MKIIPILLIYLFSSLAFGAETYTIDNFSADFYGKVYIEQTSEVFSKGWIAIINKKTDKEIIKVESDELALSLHDGKPIANIKELPYGEQSVIMYEDYNFDGKKDFAIENGQNSCYHGPSFEIYLADKQNNFIFNQDFTRLAQEYCGMFSVDATTKTLSTMTKSGCCWHQFSTFTIKNNQPKAIDIIEENSSNPLFTISSQESWNGKKMVKKVVKTFNLNDAADEVVLSFQVKKNHKKVVLFSNGNSLGYALLKEDGVAEFSYPVFETETATFSLKTTPTETTLTFGNPKATYSIYENTQDKNLGIRITVGTDMYDWEGENSTLKGNLTALTSAGYENVIHE